MCLKYEYQKILGFTGAYKKRPSLKAPVKKCDC